VTYSTPASVRAVLTPDGSSADPSSAASLDDATLQVACNKAQAEVDAMVGSNYQLPFDVGGPGTAPPLIYDISDSIAAYLATLLFRGDQPLESTDTVALGYRRALNMLMLIQAGKMDLQVLGSEPSSTQPTVVNPYNGQLFGLGDFGIGQSLFPMGGEGRGRGVFPPNWPI
jgi:phage gp36-like protein